MYIFTPYDNFLRACEAIKGGYLATTTSCLTPINNIVSKAIEALYSHNTFVAGDECLQRVQNSDGSYYAANWTLNGYPSKANLKTPLFNVNNGTCPNVTTITSISANGETSLFSLPC